MHAAPRIAACRWGFVLLCVVPTLATCGFIATHWLTLRSPAAKGEWERELSQRLGVAVTIEGLSYPRPKLAELAGVALADPETKLPLAQCQRVEIERSADGWQVNLAEPSIAPVGLGPLIRRVHDRALAASPHEALAIQFAASQLTLEADNAPLSLTNVSGQWQSTSAGPSLSIQFQLPPDENSVIECRVVRNQQLTPPVTRIEWDCPAPLPVKLACLLFPELSAVGDGATIEGSGRVTFRDGVSGELSARIDGIDLSRLVGERFPHVLTGRASLTLEPIVFDGGRSTSARGTLAAGGGRISRTLLEAAREHLRLAVQLPAEPSESAAYTKLALRFELTDRGLCVEPIDSAASGIVLDEGGPLVTAPTDHAVPAVALVRALVPESSVQVPATMQTEALLRWLPLPTVDPPLSARRRHTPTRLAPAADDRSASPIREQTVR